MHAALTVPPIHFHYTKAGFSFSERTLLKTFIQALFKKEKNKLEELHYIFCSDDYLLAMNREQLRHDYYTDILTFPLSDPGKPINAEIYISIDRVKDNANQFNTSFRSELHRVIFHGALHLCGYKDKTKPESLAMRKMEDKYLSSYFKW